MANHSADQQPTNSQTVERVLNVLDSEIGNIRNAQTQQGWTNWGLLVAIVGLLWLLTDELRTGTSQTEVVGALILIFSLLLDGVAWLLITISQLPPNSDDSVRFRWSREFFVNRLVLLLHIAKCIALILIAFLVAPKWWLPLTALVLAYGLYALFALLVLVLSFVEFPYRE